MKFKEFAAWCNERACDGAWGVQTAMACIEIMNRVYAKPLWKREKEWRSIDSDWKIEELVVKPINALIEEKKCGLSDG